MDLLIWSSVFETKQIIFSCVNNSSGVDLNIEHLIQMQALLVAALSDGLGSEKHSHQTQKLQWYLHLSIMQRVSFIQMIPQIKGFLLNGGSPLIKPASEPVDGEVLLASAQISY